MKHIVIIQPSLRSESFTHTLCKTFEQYCEKLVDKSVRFIDLRERKLEFCDGRELSEYGEEIQQDAEYIKKADYVVIGFPIYHASISGVLKNYIDVIASAFCEKQLILLCVGKNPHHQIAYEHFLESMSLKFHTDCLKENIVYCREQQFA